LPVVFPRRSALFRSQKKDAPCKGKENDPEPLRKRKAPVYRRGGGGSLIDRRRPFCVQEGRLESIREKLAFPRVRGKTFYRGGRRTCKRNLGEEARFTPRSERLSDPQGTQGRSLGPRWALTYQIEGGLEWKVPGLPKSFLLSVQKEKHHEEGEEIH